MTPHKSGAANTGASLDGDGSAREVGEDGSWAADATLDTETAAAIRQWGLAMSQMPSLGGAGVLGGSLGTHAPNEPFATYNGEGQAASFSQYTGLPGGCMFVVADNGGGGRLIFANKARRSGTFHLCQMRVGWAEV